MKECKYCEGIQQLAYEIKDNHYIDIEVNSINGSLELYYSNEADGKFVFIKSININYCPMCGRKLDQR